MITSKSTQIFYRISEVQRVVEVIAVAHRGRDITALLKGRA